MPGTPSRTTYLSRSVNNGRLSDIGENHRNQRETYFYCWCGHTINAVEDHHGGERALEKAHYYPPKLDDFTFTANSYKVVKLAARHGRTSLCFSVTRARPRSCSLAE
jgi:hypothetical protein